MHIYAGTSGFAYKEWQGKFYPEKISPKEMLRFYAGRLRTVEINNTFYHMPRKSVLATWAEQAGGDFVFAIKAPQVITHIKQLHNVFEETDYLFTALSALGRKLGPVLFQFPKSFRVDRPLLEDFLGIIPGGSACAFDFRSPTWINDEILGLLRRKGCSLCIEDTDDTLVQEIISTAPWGYLRLRRSDYTETDLTKWAERILAQQWEKAFVFFKHEDGARGAELALRFQELIGSKGEGRKKTAATGGSAAHG